MKFVFATVFTLALAMGVQCSWLPWAHHHTEVAGHGLSYTAVSSPVHGHALLAHAHLPAAVAIHESPIVHGDWHGDWHGDDGQWHGDDGQWHGDWHDGHHAAVVVDAHHGVHVPIVHLAHAHHEGQYLAKTRGAVHAAPLAGHAASAAAINVAPAPGTV